jgi:hypothetical protein
MKRVLVVFVALCWFALAGNGQIYDSATLRLRTNLDIVPNNNGSITATKLNNLLNGNINVWGSLLKTKLDSVWVTGNYLYSLKNGISRSYYIGASGGGGRDSFAFHKGGDAWGADALLGLTDNKNLTIRAKQVFINPTNEVTGLNVYNSSYPDGVLAINRFNGWIGDYSGDRNGTFLFYDDNARRVYLNADSGVQLLSTKLYSDSWYINPDGTNNLVIAGLSNKVNVGDTAAMLNPYLRKVDTIRYAAGLAAKVNVGDTSAMLNPYLRKVDTIRYATALAGKVNVGDTSAMLNPYLRKVDTIRYATALASKVNVGDTATMLNPYLRKVDTIRYATALAAKVNVGDTSAMLNGRLSSITLNNSGVIHNTPITFSRLGGAWSGTMSLANQSAYKVFWNNTNSSTTPAFNYLDSNAFGNTFANLVKACQTTYSAGRGLTLNSGTLGLDTTKKYTWTDTNTYSKPLILNNGGNILTFNASSLFGFNAGMQFLSNQVIIKNGISGFSNYDNGGMIRLNIAGSVAGTFNGQISHTPSAIASTGSTSGAFNLLNPTINLTGSYTGTVTGYSFTPSSYTNSANAPIVAYTNTVGDVKFNTSSGVATFGSTVTSTQYKLSSLNTAPISSSDTGTAGEIRITSGYIYVCTATNTWVRAALASW